MKYLKRITEKFINENINEKKWFRGYTTNTRELEYVWLTSNKQHAKSYANMNSAIYGGDKIISEFEIVENNILDLVDYDMDDRLEEYELEDIFDEILDDFDVSDMFDFSEDSIPLSRVVNHYIDELLMIYDGIIVLESSVKTICIKKEFIKIFNEINEKNIFINKKKPRANQQILYVGNHGLNKGIYRNFVDGVGWVLLPDGSVDCFDEWQPNNKKIADEEI